MAQENENDIKRKLGDDYDLIVELSEEDKDTGRLAPITLVGTEAVTLFVDKTDQDADPIVEDIQSQVGVITNATIAEITFDMTINAELTNQMGRFPYSIKVTPVGGKTTTYSVAMYIIEKNVG